ncbi:PorE family type IX secretion system protein [Xylanibacter brevis]|uniref:PorE family type IX secretion system protein n=1 Tax=Xylanibacter brevis TaxID=83231 RepID=UPI0005C50174|nr:OmpA family protein [Xylanibacter brevis]
MRKIFFILYIGIVCILLSGCGADTAMKKGDKYYALGEYYDAATQYKKAYSQTPAKERQLRGLRALKMADCYRRINHTQRAIAAYKNAIRFKQKDSLTLFHLGRLQLKNGSYKDAENTFLEMIEEGNRSQLVKNGLQSARMAPQWKAEAEYSGYTVKREDIFNSRRTDYSPMLAGDDYNQLYFSSTRNQAKGDELSGITGMKNADIFVSQKDEKGKWQKPEAIESDLNSDFDEGACAFTPDFKTMYLTVCKTDPNYPRFAKIATATRSDASWGKATDLEITKDTLSAFAHPTISPDGEWLYFVSDMPGGLGGYDIWRIQITGRGLVGLENLGAPINTEGNELFPSFRPNGDLYFSSDGHPGMGGLDIFIAKPITEERQEDTYGQTSELYTIEHPGVPLNSAGDDFGMTFEGLHNRGFFSSNRGNANGWDHIYSFEKSEVIQTVKGWVYEKDGYELPQALVYMVGNDGTNKKLNVKGDGSFTEEIHPGVDYVFLGTCKGFLNHKEELRVEPVKESEEYVLQFPLASLSAPVLIRNIFYDFDKATLRPESTQALDSLITLLNENPNITIELSSHTDFRGADAYNQRLSQRRAESVVRYLIDHGIAEDRLSPVGYGEGKPKVVKRKLTETYPWLKEGDVLTEEFINALKDEEKQEICHQLNRRTEFIVLRTTYGLGATNH